MPYKDPEVARQKAHEAYLRRVSTPEGRELHRAAGRASSAAYRANRPIARKASYTRWRQRNLTQEHARVAAWKRANRARCTDLENRRRALKLGQFVEDVERNVVYEMHGGMCGICEEFIEGAFHVDHVVPLSKGGMHGYINVQPAHPACNLRKGSRV